MSFRACLTLSKKNSIDHVSELNEPGWEISTLKNFLPKFLFSRTFAQLLSKPSASDLAGILNELKRETDEQIICSWLGYLSEVDLSDLPQEAEILIKLTQHQNAEVRAQAMVVVLNAESAVLGVKFANGNWRYIQGQSAHEALCGTYLLCLYGKHLSFTVIQERIVPQGLPYLADVRGCHEEDVTAAFEHVCTLLNEEVGNRKTKRTAYPHNFPEGEMWKKIIEKNDYEIVHLMLRHAGHHRLLGFFNFFPLIETTRAILELRPDDGVKIWHAVREAQQRSVIRVGDFENLRFIKSAHPALSRLRKEAFDTAKNDAEIASNVFLCQRNGHQSWLIDTVREYLIGASSGDIARGLTIAGFLDAADAAEILWVEHIQVLNLDGWLAQVRRAADLAFSQNRFARYWFKQYLAAKDRAEAFGALNLYGHCHDIRSLLWKRELIDEFRETLDICWLGYLDCRLDLEKSRRASIENERKRVLFNTPISGIMSPWF